MPGPGYRPVVKRKFVLIEARSRLQAGSQIQAGRNHVLLTMETHQWGCHFYT